MEWLRTLFNAENLGKTIGVGASLGGLALGLSATKKAAKANKKDAKRQRAATEKAAAISQSQFDSTRQDFAPWREAGTNALNTLTRLNTPGGMSADEISQQVRSTPGYAFREAEGQKALERAFAARKSSATGSGANLKAISRWNSDYATNAYRDWENSLKTLAGYGREGSAQLASYGQNNANQQGQLALAGANAGVGQGAEGYVGAANLWNNALQGVSQAVQPDDAYTAYLKSITKKRVA